MSEQLNLFETTPTEEWVYDILSPYLRETLIRGNAGGDCLAMKHLTNFSSVAYLKSNAYDRNAPKKWQLAFRICCRDGAAYFGVSNAYLTNVPDSLQKKTSPSKAGDGFTNFAFTPTDNGVLEYAQFLAGVLEEVIYSFQNEFDCCSRFRQCSAEKRCCHPDPGMATSCGYRKNLRAGRIFF